MYIEESLLKTMRRFGKLRSVKTVYVVQEAGVFVWTDRVIALKQDSAPPLGTIRPLRSNLARHLLAMLELPEGEGLEVVDVWRPGAPVCTLRGVETGQLWAVSSKHVLYAYDEVPKVELYISGVPYDEQDVVLLRGDGKVKGVLAVSDANLRQRAKEVSRIFDCYVKGGMLQDGRRGNCQAGC